MFKCINSFFLFFSMGLSLLSAGCNELAIFVNTSNLSPSFEDFSSIQLDEYGRLDLNWSTRGRAPASTYAIYLTELSETDDHYAFGANLITNVPLATEVIEIDRERSPRIIGKYVDKTRSNTFTFDEMLAPHHSYLVQIEEPYRLKSKKTLVAHLRLAFECTGSGSATIIEDIIHLQWNAVAGANRYEVYRDEAMTDRIMTTEKTFADLPLGNVGSSSKVFYVRAFRGDLAATGSISITLSLSPIKIVGVRALNADGIYTIGDELEFEVFFQQAVTLTGTGTLPLNMQSGLRMANYVSGSGTDRLRYHYVIQPRDETSWLKAAEVLGGSYFDDQGLKVSGLMPSAGHNTTLAEQNHIAIDTTPPTSPTSIGFAGATTASTNISVHFMESGDANLLNHSVKLCTVNDCQTGCTATQTGAHSPQSVVGAVGVPYYACVQGRDIVNQVSSWASSLQTIVVDQTVPTISDVTSSLPDGTYPAGTVIPISIHFSEAIAVSHAEDLSLLLETGAVDHAATYLAGNLSNTLTFQYIVQPGDVSSDLNYTGIHALSLGASGALTDLAGNPAVLDLPDPTSANSIGGSKQLVIDGLVPKVNTVTSSADDGTYGPGNTLFIQVNFSRAVSIAAGTPRFVLNTAPTRQASYLSGSGSSTLLFTYTVGIGDISPHLDASSVLSLILNGSTLKDNVGNDADLTLPAIGAASSLGGAKALVIAGDNHSPTLNNPLVNQNAFTGIAIGAIDFNDAGTGNDQDADGEAIVYSCRFDNSPNGSMDAGALPCSSLPQSAFTFSSSTGVFNWTPSAAAATSSIAPTTYEVAVTGTDTAHLSDTHYLVFNVLNPFTTVIPYTAGTSAAYTLSNRLNFSGNLVRLAEKDQKDDDNSSTNGFGTAGLNGLKWDTTSSFMTLGTGGYCSGSSGNCDGVASNSAWIPQTSAFVFRSGFEDTSGFFSDSTLPTFVGAPRKVWFNAGVFNGTQYLYRVRTVEDSFTINVWMFSTQSFSENSCATWSDGVGLVTTDSTGDTDDFGIHMCNGYISAGVGHPNTGIRSLARVNDGAYHFVSFTRNKTSGLIQLYIDGILQGSATGNTNSLTAGSYLYVGTRDPSSATKFVGDMDELSLWRSDLKQNEIVNLYYRQKPNKTGSYPSRPMSATMANGVWTGMRWTTTLPYGKELPDWNVDLGGIQNESSAVYSALSSNTLMNGIVALWHLNESNGGGAPSNKDFSDTSGQGNHGAIQGSIGLGLTGVLNKAALFQGAGQINIASPTGLAFGSSTSFTISSWVRFGLDAGSRSRLVGSGFITQSSGWSLELDSGKIAIGIGCGGAAVANCVFLETTSSFSDNAWHHVVAVVDRSSQLVKVYVDGAQKAVAKNATYGNCGSLSGSNLSISACTSLSANSAADTSIGGTTDGLNRFSGLIDETAVWNRAVSAAEIKDIYRRGGNRVLLQIRTCPDSACSGISWKGPDGTNQTFFSELNNNSSAAAMDGLVKAGGASIVFADFPSLGLQNKEYFQYRLLMESDDSSTAPDLKSIEITPAPRYWATSPSIVYNTGVNHYTFTSLSEVLGAGGCPGGLSYQLSPDNTSWYYYDGASWAAATTPQQSNAVVDINAHASSYADIAGRPSTLYVNVFLNSDSLQTCELDDLVIHSNSSY